jgi:predicted ATPase
VERLLERDEPLAALLGAVEAARAGSGALVLLGGEAGIGKTSLLRALRAELGESARFLTGACEPLSVPAPLQPLRELASAAEVHDLASLEGDDRLALARSLLDALCVQAPTVAVVEDAHWADPATLDVVSLLSRQVETGLAVSTVADVPCEWRYPDEQTAVAGLLSSGPVVFAIEHAGEQAVRAAVTAFLAPFRTGGGGYRLMNEFRYTIGTPR